MYKTVLHLNRLISQRVNVNFTQTDRPKSVRNHCVINGVFVVTLLFGFSVDVWTLVMELSQIFPFSLHTINRCI